VLWDARPKAAFAAMLRDRVDALLVTPDGFLASRRVQIATFAAHYGIPSAHGSRLHRYGR